jgi:hypothetical protein
MENNNIINVKKEIPIFLWEEITYASGGVAATGLM